MRAVVVLVAMLLAAAVVPAGGSGSSAPVQDLQPMPPPLHEPGDVTYDANVAAWTDYYVASTGEETVPADVLDAIWFVSQYSGPEPRPTGPVPDDVLPYAVHSGYMYLECDFGIDGGCFWDDWWDNSGIFCSRTSYHWPVEYTQIHSTFTMGEWGNGWVSTITEDDLDLHYSSLIDGAIVAGYICVAQIGFSIVGVLSGTGVFDNDYLVDPAPPPWQVVPVEVPRPPPPYDNLGPPFCGYGPLPGDSPKLCWGPDDLLPQVP